MEYLIGITTTIGIVAVLGVGYDLIFGYGGRFSVAPVGFYAIGAYVGGVVLTRFSDQFAVGLVLAFVAAYLTGLVLGRISLHLQVQYFAVATLGFHFAMYSLALNWRSVTGGFNGLGGIPRPIFGSQIILSNEGFLAFVLLILFLVTVTVWIVTGSPFGRSLRATRDDQLAASGLGIESVTLVRRAFAFSAGISGLAGVLHATYIGYVQPDSFRFEPLILLLSIVIIGGTGTTIGPVAGAAAIIAITELLRYLQIGTPQTSAFIQNAMYAGLLILFVLRRSGGLVREEWLSRLRNRSHGHRPPVSSPSPDARWLAQEAVPDIGELRVESVSKRFGGLQAVCDVSLVAKPGSITGIVGPNGSGKSTFLGCLSGVTHPEEGRIWLGGDEITQFPIQARATKGIVQMFQQPRLFKNLTVRENLLVAHSSLHQTSLVASLFRARRLLRLEREVNRSVDMTLQWIDMSNNSETLASKLSHGQQKLVALGRALSTSCGAILLDEPTAGVAPSLVPQLLERIRELADRGMIVCLVEHNLEVVEELCDHVMVLDQGKLIRQGGSRDVLSDPEVQRIYLGVTESSMVHANDEKQRRDGNEVSRN